ncbi:uncharacterized protein LOC112089102 [Eutrema salsugineum]|uniref:uncharacterized protein LOC112089102 n=1 Tax=Eutrema salsugineum TaxID=72664 RepID=UPI000CED5CB1|nr:uncharacterized protein LOC112089102 [Eutrema salsugineum]
MQHNSVWLTPQYGSSYSSSLWVCKEILKVRDLAAFFLKVELGNGKNDLFWYDRWSSMGNLLTLLGPKVFIDLGIGETSTLRDFFLTHRRRRHRYPILNRVEYEIDQAKARYQPNAEDSYLWRVKENDYKRSFNTRTTRDLVRNSSPKVPWTKGIWFTHHCPKFGFIAWLALLDRLSTGDRTHHWNANLSTVCVLCNHQLETCCHLFFSCPYSKQYTIYGLWREGNERRHRGNSKPTSKLVKDIDKGIINQFSAIHLQGDSRYEEGLQLWFASRPKT